MNKTNLFFIAVIVVLLAAVGGYFAGKRGMGHTAAHKTTAVSNDDARKPLYWVAPMDSSFRRDKPGKSPMGMDLVPVYDNGSDSDVRIDPAVVNNLGVRTAEVQQGALSNRIEAVGYVGYDEDSIVSINTRADGWIEKLAVNSVGEAVQRGQLLYALFSPKLATAEREYLTALSSGSTALIAASGERMRALGFSAAQIHALARTRKVGDRVSRYAENAGVVISLGVREGAYVMPETPVMKLADLSNVWVLADIDAGQIALLRKGQKASATFDAFPDQRWQGTVDYVYPDINPTTRTAKVRLRFDNADRRLQPNMYARVSIQAAPQTDAVYIPIEALIRTGHSQRVIVALGDGNFDVCPVQAGVSSGDQVEILKGLSAGQRVVTSAQFMIDSEANVDAAALRLGAGKAGCTKQVATVEQQHDDASKPMDAPMSHGDHAGMQP